MPAPDFNQSMCMPFSKEAPTEGRPAVVVRDALAEDPSCSRKALAAAAKRNIKSQKDADWLLQVQDQGEMLCTTTSDTAPLKAKTVQALSSNTMKFALNAAHDTLLQSAAVEEEGQHCLPLCGERQSLLHVLNNSKGARNLRRYNDAVLQEIVKTIQPSNPSFS